MPALSPTMEEGTLAKWHVKVGDAVRSGDVIAEIETDKATMEVEAVDEGVVEALLVPEGTEEVKVNTPIARLKGEGEAAQRRCHAQPASRQRRLPPAGQEPTSAVGSRRRPRKRAKPKPATQRPAARSRLPARGSEATTACLRLAAGAPAGAAGGHRSRAGQGLRPARARSSGATSRG